MTLPSENLYRAESVIYAELVKSRRRKLLGVSNLQAAEMAGLSVKWAARGYGDNLVGDALKREVRRQFADRYGSIWTLILFTVIWELIKHYLFESKAK